MKEKLELVESFSALRAGMIVVIKPCTWCGSSVRGMLLTPKYMTVHRPDGSSYPDTAWILVPPHNESGTTWGLVATEATVAKKRLYRVIDGLESSQETHTTKPRKLVTRG